MKNGFIRKADIILAVVLLILGFGSTALLYSSSEKGTEAVITLNGEHYKTVSLAIDSEFDVVTENGHNHIVIENNEIFVDDADCKNHDCMGFGRISKEGQIIVCLPHRLMIQIKGGEGIDAVNY